MAGTLSSNAGIGTWSRITPRSRTSSSRQASASAGRTPRISDALAKDHHLFDSLLLLPRPLDERGALGAEPGHLVQTLRRLLQDAERVHSKVVDDPLRHPGADALDQPGAEVAADALDGGREHGGVAVHLELAAVHSVVPPAPFHAQVLTWLRAGQWADHGEQVAVPTSGDPGDDIAGL